MWRLMWCLAIACGPGDIKTDFATDWYASKDECVVEANRRLEKEPQMQFICQEAKPVISKSNLNELLAALKEGKVMKPKYEEIDSVLIGPKRLTY